MNVTEDNIYTVVLGVTQDAGFPQVGCTRICCNGDSNMKHKKYVSCIALVIHTSERRKVWLFDCTPDFRAQYILLQTMNTTPLQLEGIFLTHAHIGHYTGLMFLGREAMSTKFLPVYCMSRMKGNVM